MVRLLVMVLCFLALGGCSVPIHITRDIEVTTQAEKSEVKSITIERWGDTKFSGLLGLQRSESEVHYALLDATGIKILEADVTRSGEQKILHAKGSMQDSKLPEYMATWLRRVYLLNPVQEPCSSTILKRFCSRSNEQAGLRKSFRFTSFLMWDVQQSVLETGKARLVYFEPWIGVRIIINEI